MANWWGWEKQAPPLGRALAKRAAEAGLIGQPRYGYCADGCSNATALRWRVIFGCLG